MPKTKSTDLLTLQLTLTSVGSNAGNNRGISRSRSNILSREVSKERSISLAESTRRSEPVNLANTTKVSTTLSIGSSIRRSKQLSRNRRLNNSRNVLEHVAFSKDVAAGTNLKRMSRVRVPVVVDGVQEGVTLHLGGTTTGVVDVVTLHGDEIARSIEVNAPVVVAVAGGGVVTDAVDKAVGDGNALGGVGAEDDVLTTDAGGRDVVDPDHVGVVDGDGIAAPDVLGVDVGEGDVPVFVRLENLVQFGNLVAYWMMMLLAPLTIRIPLPLMIPADPEPMRDLLDLTVIPRTPALSLKMSV